MTTQPPVGPPSGPPTGPPEGPLSGGHTTQRKRRPFWRSWWAVGLILVLVVLAGLSVLMMGGESSGGRTTGEAQKLTHDVVATAGDWGTGFTETGETEGVEELVVRKDCENINKASRTGTLAALERDVEQQSGTLSGFAMVRVFQDSDTAKQYVDDAESAIHRCPTQTYGNMRYEDIREAEDPNLTGLDQSVSEQGRETYDADNQKTDWIYLARTARQDDVVLIASLTGPPNSETELHQQTTAALKKMQERLDQQ